MRRKSARLSMGVTVLFIGMLVSPIYSLAEKGQYDSNAGVGFYGTYEKDEESSLDPKEPMPEIEVPEAKIPEITTPVSAKPMGRLPALGVKSNSSELFMSIGLICLFLTVANIIYYKRRVIIK